MISMRPVGAALSCLVVIEKSIRHFSSDNSRTYRVNPNAGHPVFYGGGFG
jgi:hypothetical protein